MRHLLTTLAFLLPPSQFKNRLLNRLGHDIHRTAILGICLVQHVDRFELAEGVRIGHLNYFSYLRLVRMGFGSRLVMFNQVLGASGFEPGARDDGDRRTLQIGSNSHVISHYLDCGGGVILADECWITGRQTTVLSHAFDPEDGSMLLQPVTMADRSVIATSCTLLPGTVVGEGALVAAGSTTWTGQELAPHSLHGGVPARRLSKITIPAKAYERHRYVGGSSL